MGFDTIEINLVYIFMLIPTKCLMFLNRHCIFGFVGYLDVFEILFSSFSWIFGFLHTRSLIYLIFHFQGLLDNCGISLFMPDMVCQD